MAWTVPSNRTTGDLITAAIWNENLGASANSKILRDGGIAIASQAAGDVLYGSSATQLARLAIGTENKVLTSSGSVPQWSTSLDLAGTLDVTGATTLDSTLEVVSTGASALTVQGGAVINEASGDVDFRVESNGNANMLFVDGGTDRVGIGLAAPDHVLDIDTGTGRVQIRTVNGDALQITENDADALGGNVALQKSRGSYASPGNVVNADSIGGIVTSAYSGSAYFATAQINFAIDGTFTSNQRPPSRMEFHTNAANAAVTERMRIDDAGNVAIGTAVADARLHVFNGSAGTVVPHSTADEFIIENSAGAGMSIITPDANDGRIAWSSPSTTADIGCRIMFNFDSDLMTIGQIAGGAAVYLQGANVGINQSSPTHKLHVVGDIKLQNSQVHLTDGYGLLWGDNGFNGNAATDSLRFDTAGGARLTINNLGLVTVGNNLSVVGNTGLGTAAPGSKLDISVPAGAAQLTIQAGTSDSVTGEASIKLISRNSGSGSSPPAEIRCIWGGSNDSDLAFLTTTDGSTMVEHMRIMDDGNVGIGTTGPNAQLEVVDPATSGGTLDVLKLTTSSTNDIAPRLLMEANRNSVVQQVAFFIEASTGAGAKLRISTDNTSGTLTDALAIDSSQLVGIGNTAPKSALHVSDASLHGNIHSGGNTTVLGSLFNHQTVASGYTNISMLNNSGGANARINLGFGVIASNVPTNTVMTLIQTGIVGIGVVPGSGEAKLHVNTTGNSVGFELSQNVSGEIGARINGGSTAQSHALVIRNGSDAISFAVTDSGVIQFKEASSAPASVATFGMLYALDDDTLGYRDGNGTAHILRYD